MFYITGDTHCPIDMEKLSRRRFDDRNMSWDNDFLIICGDAGFVWQKDSAEDAYWQKWLNKKNFTILFVDGNHENHEILNEMSVEMWNGGKIHKIKENIIHLMRGQVYNINGTTFFTMGGASSHDKKHRIENVSWWPRELPSQQEYQEAINNLTINNWRVDYVITHCAPDTIQKLISDKYKSDELTIFFNNIMNKLTYKKWFFGHYHINKAVTDKMFCLYNNIIELRTNNNSLI